MAEELVITATGTDRPGIIDEVSHVLLEGGGNIVDSRTVNLRGQFALLLLVQADRESLESLQLGLKRLSDSGIQIDAQPAKPAAERDVAGAAFRLSVGGRDQSGVLHRLSHLLRVLSVNIDDVEAHVEADSFALHMKLWVPRQTPVLMLREYLGQLFREMGISGELTEA